MNVKYHLLVASTLACVFFWASSAMGSNPGTLSTDDAANAVAPDQFRVDFETTRGTFRIEVQRDLAPVGVDRFYYLVTHGFYDGLAFFRVIENFIAQFGIHSDPVINRVWRHAQIPDDPVVESNLRGTLAFAKAGPDTRTTQLYFNLRDNENLDAMGFAPFAHVIDGMDVLDSIYSGYGEGWPSGNGPNQEEIQEQGKTYLSEQFPHLDYIIEARILH